MVAECLDLGLPDRAKMLGLDVADLEALRQRRIGLIVEVRAKHRESVAHRLIAGVPEQRLLADGLVADLGLQVAQRHAGLVLGDLADARLEGREHRPPDPPPGPGWIQEADHVVHKGPFPGDLLGPLRPGVAHHDIVHRDDEQVASRIAVREVTVELGEVLVGGRERDAVSHPAAIGDRVHGRVVGRGTQPPDGEAGDGWQFDDGHGDRVAIAGVEGGHWGSLSRIERPAAHRVSERAKEAWREPPGRRLGPPRRGSLVVLHAP